MPSTLSTATTPSCSCLRSIRRPPCNGAATNRSPPCRSLPDCRNSSRNNSARQDDKSSPIKTERWQCTVEVPGPRRGDVEQPREIGRLLPRLGADEQVAERE